MSKTLKIITPSDQLEIPAGQHTNVVAELHADTLWESIMSTKLNAEVSVREAVSGQEVKMGAGIFSDGKVEIPIDWPTAAGKYKVTVKAIGHFGYGNALDTVDVTVVPKT